MKFLIVGYGSIGQRHMKNLMFLGHSDITVVETSEYRRKEIEDRFQIKSYYSMDEALSLNPPEAENPQSVLICTPNSLHISFAIKAAEAGCHLFIEKPLSNTMDGAQRLSELIKGKNLKMLLGSNFKFHPSFKQMKELIQEESVGKILSSRCQFGQYLPDWHPWEDYRKGYSANSSLGGGILLDAHEFDYMMWFLGDIDEVFCFSGKLSNLEIDTEDTAEVLLKFKTGTIGEIHLDYTQRAYQRNYEFFGENGTIKWDFNDNEVKVFHATEKKWKIYKNPDDYDLNQMYVDEMQHFINCIEEKDEPITDIDHSIKVLKAILAAKESSISGRVVCLS